MKLKEDIEIEKGCNLARRETERKVFKNGGVKTWTTRRIRCQIHINKSNHSQHFYRISFR
jgi:hypothetical protein